MGARWREETKARQWAWLASVFLVALAVRLYGLGELPLGSNEEATFPAVSSDWRHLFANRLASAHSPFYFAILKAAGFTARRSCGPVCRRPYSMQAPPRCLRPLVFASHAFAACWPLVFSISPRLF